MELISIRIPKTASHTLEAYLHITFGEQKTVLPSLDYPSRYKESELYRNKQVAIDKIAKWAKEIEGNDYCHAHIPLWAFRGLFPGVPRIVFMRDPATRVISSFFFAKSLGDIPPAMGIFEYMEIPWRRNWQSWFMDGSLVGFDFIGFTESFYEDVGLLYENVLHMECPEKQVPQNVAVDPVYLQVRQDLLKDRMFLRTVRKLYKEDYNLYKGAWKKWKNPLPLRIIL